MKSHTKSVVRYAFIFTVLTFRPLFGATIIGPFEVGASATSATLISGGGSLFKWINSANTPLTLSEALTDATLIETGFANAALGTTIELGFAQGAATNNAGSDLVLFEAFGIDQYVISTSFDGFVTEFTLAASDFIDTGLSRSYFYGGNGPFESGVFGAAIDLSSLGVSSGTSVSAVRIRYASGNTGGGDPLGIAALVPEPSTISLFVIGVVLAAFRWRSKNS
jgi:PEP-CTERM motif